MGRFLSHVMKAVLPFVLGIAALLLAFTGLGGPAFTFWVCAAAAVLPGIFILLSEDIVRTAFWLLCSLTGFAGFYVLLGADFLAITQVMVYLGGIMILILFGVLLTSKDPAVTRRVPRLNQVVPGLAAAAVLVAGLFSALLKTDFHNAKRQSVEGAALPALPETTVYDIGHALLTDYILPFEIASVLLLAALVGATYISRRGYETQPEQARG